MNTANLFKLLALSLASLLLLLGCSQARKLAKTAEQAGDFRKQAASVLEQFSQNDFTWPEWLATEEALAPLQKAPSEQGLFATISTSKGRIELQLAYRLAPQACATFLRLAQKGSYKRFLRNGNAAKKSTYLSAEASDTVAASPVLPEFSELLQFRHAGILAMPTYSEFWITLKAQPQFYGQYPAFGKVLRGLELAQSLGPENRILSIQVRAQGTSAESFAAGIAQGTTQNSIQSIAAKSLYERHGIAVLHQHLAQDFANVNWPRSQTQKLQRSKLRGEPTNWPTQAAFWGIEHKLISEGEGPNMRDSGAEQAEIKYAAWVTQEDAKTVLLDDILRGDKSLWLDLAELPPAWSATLLEMKRGERRLLVLPPEGMYGILGSGAKIAPWSYIIMDMILIEYRSN